MVGRTHSLKALLKRRRTGIKTILRNQKFSVKTCKMANLGPSRANGVPMEWFNQNHLAIPGGYPPVEAILMKRKKSYQANFEKSTL